MSPYSNLNTQLENNLKNCVRTLVLLNKNVYRKFKKKQLSLENNKPVSITRAFNKSESKL